MICACPMASSECSIPSPHTSPQSKGRLAWVEDVVLACPLHSKQLRRKTAPKPRNYAATLPLRMSHCLCLHRGAEKTWLFKKTFFLVVEIPGCPPALPDNVHTDQDCKSCPMQHPWQWLCPLLKSYSALNATAAVYRGCSGREMHAMYVFRHI